MKICNNCGEDVADKSKFCTKCGSAELSSSDSDSITGKEAEANRQDNIEPERDTTAESNDSTEKPPGNASSNYQIKKPSLKTTVISAALAVTFLTVVIAVFGFMTGPMWFNASAKNYKTAVKKFNSLSADIKETKDKLSGNIKEAEKTLDGTKVEELADPDVLEHLQNEINAAKSLSVDIPKMALENTGISNQIKYLKAQKNKLKEQYNALSTTVAAIDKSKQQLAENIAAEKKANIQEIITPNNSYSIIVTDSNGYKEKITITMGSWIKGSEEELLKKAWKAIDGEGSMPLTDTVSVDSCEVEFTPNASAYVFGTLYVDNITSNFDAALFGDGTSEVYLSMKGESGSDFGTVVKAIGVSDGNKFGFLQSGDRFISPKMTSNIWGPVPFVIGADKMFSPNAPNGNPAFDSAYFIMTGSSIYKTEGDTKFSIGKTW